MAKSPSHERGFVLIGAIWLLVLAGTIAAALMLRSVNVSRAAAAEGGLLAERLALDGAVETAFASLLFDGPRSPWASQPANEVRIAGRTLTVTVSAENGRLDANSADPAIVASALQGLGVASGPRTRLIAALQGRRSTAREFRTAAELRALLASAAASPDDPCLEDVFTLFSRLEQPSQATMPAKLAKALGLAATTDVAGGAFSSAGGPVRVEARTSEGAGLTSVARISGATNAPVTIHRWDYRIDCPSR